MARVRELGLQSVAFPALGTGDRRLPARRGRPDRRAPPIRDELPRALVEHVVFALRGAAAYDAFARALSATSRSRHR